jgi:hypothetical protein
LAYIHPVVFIETPIFYRRVQQYMEDEDYAEMQAYLTLQSGAGKVIQGTWNAQTAVGGQWPRKTRRLAGVLLLVGGERPDFIAAGLSEE